MKDDNSRAAFSLIRNNIDRCIVQHTECHLSIFGEALDESLEPELPKRVLVIEGLAAPFRIRLLITEGLRGQYAALSYCWGTQDTTTGITTTESIADHCNSVSFEMLPKTLQDSVVVTRELGLSYLWVDRLCILQDNGQDWAEQSAMMGTIYGRALITIVAAAAEDPSQGCFQTLRPPHYEISAPYYPEPDKSCGLFYLSLASPYSASPETSPLRQRGWAFQEWRLSRRKVFFTEGGLSWKCNKWEIAESCTTLSFQQYPGWESMVEAYTECKLTFEKDRIVAFQGITNEWQRVSHDVFHMGIGKRFLPVNLLWMVQRVQSEADRLPLVPTWSWASQPGSKRTWDGWIDLEVDLTEKCLFDINNNPDVMIVRAPLRRCGISGYTIDYDQPWNLDEESIEDKTPEVLMVSDRSDPVHCILGVGHQSQQVVGIAGLDKELYTDLYCLFVASSSRSKTDVLLQSLRSKIADHKEEHEENRASELALLFQSLHAEIMDHEDEWAEELTLEVRYACDTFRLSDLTRIIGSIRKICRGMRHRTRCALGSATQESARNSWPLQTCRNGNHHLRIVGKGRYVTSRHRTGIGLRCYLRRQYSLPYTCEVRPTYSYR